MKREATANAGEVRILPRWIEEGRTHIAELRSRFPLADLRASTVAEYERRGKRLKAMRAAGEGLDIGQMVKRERYVWRAAGNFLLTVELRQAMREADKIWKASHASEGDRWKAYRVALDAVEKAEANLTAWGEQDWKNKTGSERRRQANHRKTPASDSQLSRFYEVTKRSKYRPAFLAMEFAGVRPEEFGKGVEVKAARQTIDGKEVAGLHFRIEGAKGIEEGSRKAKGGKGHGQPVRTVFVPLPTDATPEIKGRFAEMLRLVQATPGKTLVVKVNGNRPAGELVSECVRDFAKKMGPGPKISAYSFRNRFTAHAKASGTVEDVALMLGHQSTETQKHYGRMQRGGGRVSPVAVYVGERGQQIQPRGPTEKRKPTRRMSAAHRSGAPPPFPRF